MEKTQLSDAQADSETSEAQGSPPPAGSPDGDSPLTIHPHVPIWRITISLILLFLNYFLAQYDKFILSYFQDEVLGSFNLGSSGYGVLSGYATGIVYAFLALPTAYIADYTSAR
ncbi:MAG: hypothetical protein Q9174_004693, partial [Haloplaca sp. 1 TL-2023]